MSSDVSTLYEDAIETTACQDEAARRRRFYHGLPQRTQRPRRTARGIVTATVSVLKIRRDDTTFSTTEGTESTEMLRLVLNLPNGHGDNSNGFFATDDTDTTDVKATATKPEP